MTDISFEEYWAAVTAEIKRIYGLDSGDLGVRGDRIAERFRSGDTIMRTGNRVRT